MPEVECPLCDGSGEYENQFGNIVKCRACNGSGKIER